MTRVPALLAALAVTLAPAAAPAQQPRAAVYLAIVKPSSPAAQAGLEDWSQAFKRGLDVALYDAMSTAFGSGKIQVQKADYDSAPSLQRLETLRKQREAIYIVSAVASQAGEVTTISSTVMLGDLSGALAPVIEIRQRVNLNDYRADRDALTVLTLYGLANEAGRLGKKAAACRLLAKANLVAGGADLQLSGLADLPKVIRDAKKSRSCG
jgi:hypothetical protein